VTKRINLQNRILKKVFKLSKSSIGRNWIFICHSQSSWRVRKSIRHWASPA